MAPAIRAVPDAIESELPSRAWARRLIELPKCAKFKMLAADPIRAKLRRDRLEPNAAKLRTLVDEAAFSLPDKLQPEPTRA
jgi:hypothetical protein